MSKTQGVRISLEHLAHGTPVSNSVGFNSRRLPTDTVPGPGKGAPLSSSRTVDDQHVVRSRTVSGNPYNKYTCGQPGHVLGELDEDAPVHDGPIRGHGEQPDRDADAKAPAVRAGR